MDFTALRSRIAMFQKIAPSLVAKEAEEFFKDNVRLGGNQMSSGYVKPFHPRKKTYGHPMLMETTNGGLIEGINAKYNRKTIVITAKAANYRGSRDYVKIHNKLGTPTKIGNSIELINRPFLSKPKAFNDKMGSKLSGMLKKIFI